ncbi:MAG TPA: S8 family peptidase [Rubrivivax sp.]|nr:S8 family peptidase [Rubrivivax sp.]
MRRFDIAWAGALLAALCAAPAQADPVDTAPARGLIVRLKQPVAHERLSARGADAVAPAQEAARWQRVLGEAGLSGASGRREPRLKPVGRDQQLIEFERPLSRSEAASLRDKLLARPDVAWAEANVRQKRLQATPSDPLFTEQWWLQPASGSNANALEARRRGVAGFQNAWLRAGSAPVVVAVLDTGITAHPDLAGRTLPGYDFVSVVDYANDGDGRDSDASDPGDWVGSRELGSELFYGCAAEDSSWHGTIVAGIIAAHTGNGLGVAGIAAPASVLPVRVAGKCGADLDDIIDGMRWAAGLPVAGVPLNPNPARIINISFGGSAACGSAYQAAVDELKAEKGAVVVAAAGNGWGAPSRPASCRDVVGVAGLNRDGFKSNYSNFGSALAASGIATVSGDDADGAWGNLLADSGLVTLTNRGTNVPGTPGYARLFGTSFAAPQVAGTVALMLSLNPALSHEQILHGLRASARPHVSSPKMAACSESNPGRCICSTASCGAGILDAEQALIYASMPGSYVAPVRQAEVIDHAELDAALARAPQDRPAGSAPVADARGAGGDSGGGAFGGFWLLALATAAITLPLVRPRPPRA